MTSIPRTIMRKNKTRKKKRRKEKLPTKKTRKRKSPSNLRSLMPILLISSMLKLTLKPTLTRSRRSAP